MSGQTVNSGETEFSRWLIDQGLSRWTFCELHGLRRNAVSAIAEPRKYATYSWNSLPTLMKISEVTGISLDRLVAEVMAGREAAE